jgi:hypothetical protein
MPLYMFLHDLLNVLLQVEIKRDYKKTSAEVKIGEAICTFANTFSLLGMQLLTRGTNLLSSCNQLKPVSMRIDVRLYEKQRH